MNSLLFVMLLVSGNQAFASTWDSSNDPKNFETDYEYHFSALPMKGTLSDVHMPWSETYWPENKGSINYRWNAPAPSGFNYTPPTKAAVMQMSRDELATLSPSEKYDIAMGNYNYPIKTEVNGYSNKLAAGWHGICHGWSPAALQYTEPKPVDFVNPDGVVVPFGSSDVKGLLSFFMAFHAKLNVASVGKSCKKVVFIGNGGCSDDINAGALHVVVTNQLGLRGEGFVADVDNTSQIWNQPVYGYEVNAVASAEPDEGVSGVQVNMTLHYTDELDASQYLPTNGTQFGQTNKLELSYILSLDADGKIIGGKWLTKNYPDFFWKAKTPAVFDGEFSGLANIYKPNL